MCVFRHKFLAFDLRSKIIISDQEYNVSIHFILPFIKCFFCFYREIYLRANCCCFACLEIVWYLLTSSSLAANVTYLFSSDGQCNSYVYWMIACERRWSKRNTDFWIIVMSSLVWSTCQWYLGCLCHWNQFENFCQIVSIEQHCRNGPDSFDGTDQINEILNWVIQFIKKKKTKQQPNVSQWPNNTLIKLTDTFNLPSMAIYFLFWCLCSFHFSYNSFCFFSYSSSSFLHSTPKAEPSKCFWSLCVICLRNVVHLDLFISSHLKLCCLFSLTYRLRTDILYQMYLMRSNYIIV